MHGMNLGNFNDGKPLLDTVEHYKAVLAFSLQSRLAGIERKKQAARKEFVVSCSSTSASYDARLAAVTSQQRVERSKHGAVPGGGSFVWGCLLDPEMNSG
jgi:hypothetical protein